MAYCIELVRRTKYADDVYAELLKAGWDPDTADLFLNNVPDANVCPDSPWISATERLPGQFERVIVCRDDGKVEQGYKDVGDWWKVYGTRTKRVTHWMPLPAAPDKEDPV